MQTEGLAEMEEVHCVRKHVEAFYVISLMPLMIVDEFGGDEGFKDDELLFYEWLTVKTYGKVH